MQTTPQSTQALLEAFTPALTSSGFGVERVRVVLRGRRQEGLVDGVVEKPWLEERALVFWS